MESVNVTVRMDKEIKQEFETFCDNVGINVTTAFNMFVKATLRTRKLPFTVTDIDTQKKESEFEFFDKIKKQNFELEETKKFNSVIENCDDKAIQRLTREISVNDLTKAIKGLSEISVKKFLFNVSRRNAEMIIEKYLSLENLNESDILSAQNNILNEINKLKENGEIIFNTH